MMLRQISNKLVGMSYTRMFKRKCLSTLIFFCFLYFLILSDNNYKNAQNKTLKCQLIVKSIYPVLNISIRRYKIKIQYTRKRESIC